MTRHLYLVGYRGTGKTTVGRLVAAALGCPFVDLDERIEAVAGRSIAAIFAEEGETGFRDRESAALMEVALLPLSETERGPRGEVWPEGMNRPSSVLGETSPPNPLSEAERGDPRNVALLPLSVSERGPGGEVWPEVRGNKNQAVISTGGGIVLREENRQHLKRTGLVVWLQASAETIWARLQADATTAGRRPNLSGGGLAEIIELLAVRERFYQQVADGALDTDCPSPEALAATILTMIDFTPSD